MKDKSEIQEVIDELLEDDVDSLIVGGNEKNSKGEVIESDLVKIKINEQNKNERLKKEREDAFKKAEAEQRKSIEAHLKKEKRWRMINPFIKFFKWIFSPITYIGLIQHYEDLIFVIFINSLTLFTFLPIIYIFIIVIRASDIVKSDGYDILYFKLIGSAALSIICIIAQNYLPPSGNNKNEGE